MSFSRLPLPPRSDHMPKELQDLKDRIHRLDSTDRPELEILVQRVADSVQRRRRILALVQEALAQLRLDVKYLMFDLEVTRRERDELKEKLDQ